MMASDSSLPSTFVSASTDTNDDRSAASLSRRRFTLPLTISSPLNNQSLKDVQESGEILFCSFVKEELKEQGVTDELDLHLPLPTDDGNQLVAVAADVETVQCLRHQQPRRASTPEGYKNIIWTKIGRELRELADTFARSPEGVKVRERADSVSLSHITKNGFISLLQELFIEGFSRERLIALFYYCMILFTRSVKEKAFALLSDLFTWSLEYIRNKVSLWVYQRGGWEKVLKDMDGRTFFLIATAGFFLGAGVMTYMWLS